MKFFLSFILRQLTDLLNKIKTNRSLQKRRGFTDRKMPPQVKRKPGRPTRSKPAKDMSADESEDSEEDVTRPPKAWDDPRYC